MCHLYLIRAEIHGQVRSQMGRLFCSVLICMQNGANFGRDLQSYKNKTLDLRATAGADPYRGQAMGTIAPQFLIT